MLTELEDMVPICVASAGRVILWYGGLQGVDGICGEFRYWVCQVLGGSGGDVVVWGPGKVRYRMIAMDYPAKKKNMRH